MAAIAMERTWLIDDSRQVLPSIGGAGATARNLLWMIVQQLKGVYLPNMPVKWTVVESCDGTAVAASDLWTSGSSIVRAATGAHSWTVLFNGTIYLVIDCVGIDEGRLAYFRLSSDRPIGGTTIASPRGAKETSEVNSNWMAGFFDTANTAWRMHTRVDQFGGFWIGLSQAAMGCIRSWLAVQKLAGAPSGDQFPWAIHGATGSSAPGGMTFVKLASTTYTWLSRSPDDSVPVKLISCGGALGASTSYVLGNVAPNPADGTIPRYAIPLASNTAYYEHGRGYLPDWYWGPTEYENGTLMPGAPNAVQFTLFGDIWLPAAASPIF